MKKKTLPKLIYSVTPLMGAIQENDTQQLKTLIAFEGVDINEQNRWGETALHVAIGHNNLEHLRLLVEGGANLDLQDDWGKTPLMRAIEGKNPFIIEFMTTAKNINEGN